MPHQARDATSSSSRSRRERVDPAVQLSPLKRMRVESPDDKPRVAASTSPMLVRRLPPLHTLTTARAATAQAGGDRARDKLDQLRTMYEADIALVYRELKVALDVCKSPHALPGIMVPSAHVRKLEMSVETLQKLFRLLSARPAPRLRGPAHFSLLCAVETQIQTQVLPVATVIRSFEHTSALLEPKVAPSSSRGVEDAAASKSVLLSPRSPSAVLPVSSSYSFTSSSASSSSSSVSTAAATEKAAEKAAEKVAEKASDAGCSWRYLSMVLSLQL